MEEDSNNIHILLIEDDEDDYLIIRDCLMEHDDHRKFTLEWVQTYQAGLLQIQRARHDIYLIDYLLGANSGLELLREAIYSGCQAPIIMVTGQSDREIDQAALLAGATDYLVKGRMDGQLLDRSIRYALERNRLLREIRELAVRDALTGLYNRRELHRFLDYEHIKSTRYNHPISLMMMDVDHFKKVNDRLGHQMGDKVLCQVAKVLLTNTRKCDLLARYGGDEFILVLPETSAHQAWYSAERLRRTVDALPIQVTTKSGASECIDVTMSIGIAEFQDEIDSGDALIEMADQALFLAKHRGSNQVVLYGEMKNEEKGSQ